MRRSRYLALFESKLASHFKEKSNVDSENTLIFMNPLGSSKIDNQIKPQGDQLVDNDSQIWLLTKSLLMTENKEGILDLTRTKSNIDYVALKDLLYSSFIQEKKSNLAQNLKKTCSSSSSSSSSGHRPQTIDYLDENVFEDDEKTNKTGLTNNENTGHGLSFQINDPESAINIVDELIEEIDNELKLSYGSSHSSSPRPALNSQTSSDSNCKSPECHGDEECKNSKNSVDRCVKSKNGSSGSDGSLEWDAGIEAKNLEDTIKSFLHKLTEPKNMEVLKSAPKSKHNIRRRKND